MIGTLISPIGGICGTVISSGSVGFTVSPTVDDAGAGATAFVSVVTGVVSVATVVGVVSDVSGVVSGSVVVVVVVESVGAAAALSDADDEASAGSTGGVSCARNPGKDNINTMKSRERRDIVDTRDILRNDAFVFDKSCRYAWTSTRSSFNHTTSSQCTALSFLPQTAFIWAQYVQDLF